jgi:hypothetical protein
MFERWERCEATVVARQVRTSEAGYEVVLDVVPTSAPPLRVVLDEGTDRSSRGFREPQVGELVGVFYDVNSRAVKFDDDDPRLSLAAGKQAIADAFASVSASAAGALSPAPTGYGAGVYAASTVEGEVFFAGRTPDVLASMHTPPSGLAADPGERLVKLQALKEQGFLTEDEYRLQRQRLIDTI